MVEFHTTKNIVGNGKKFYHQKMEIASESLVKRSRYKTLSKAGGATKGVFERFRGIVFFGLVYDHYIQAFIISYLIEYNIIDFISNNLYLYKMVL